MPNVVTGESIQNITQEIPGVINTFDNVLDLIVVENKFIKTAIIFIIFFSFSYLIKYISSRFLKNWAKKTKSEIDDEIIETVEGPIFWLFVSMGLLLTIGWFFNSMNAPTYFVYLGTGRLRWNTLAHIAMGIMMTIINRRVARGNEN